MGKIYNALDIANYFLFKAAKDEELLSNLKLQKLVYYAQGIHLAYDGTPLFKDIIKAWTYGPVVPGLYKAYKEYGAGAIPADESFNPKNIDKDTKEFLDEIYKAFGQFSATRLMDFTHTDQCWKDAHPNGIITHKSMQECLKKYLKNDKKN
jgi:uncharacterized phage-associated protein